MIFPLQILNQISFKKSGLGLGDSWSVIIWQHYDNEAIVEIQGGLRIFLWQTPLMSRMNIIHDICTISFTEIS